MIQYILSSCTKKLDKDKYYIYFEYFHQLFIRQNVQSQKQFQSLGNIFLFKNIVGIQVKIGYGQLFSFKNKNS